MAPRSGWWQCASEQGSRLVCWLEVMRALAYLKRHPELSRRAHAWIFFGSSIGEPAQPNEIYAADEALDLWKVVRRPNCQ